MRVTPFLCRLHRNSFRYTGRISDAGRHNQDIGVMLLPAGSLDHLFERCPFLALEQFNQCVESQPKLSQFPRFTH